MAVLQRLDHVGYLARDVEAEIERFAGLGLPVVRRIELPQYALRGAFLGAGTGEIEVFTFTDGALLEARLGGRDVVIDHVAYAVGDVRASGASLAAEGVRFAGPDGRGEVSPAEPVELGGVLHLWTLPDTAGGHALQLLQRP